MYPAAERVISEALKSFLEDLLRNAYGTKLEADRKTYVKMFISLYLKKKILFLFYRELFVDESIRTCDLRKAITTSPQFDFLSNKYCGLDITKRASQLRD